ncbi:glycosyltransferase family 2 protein [Flavobacterium gawalongense]|uniref:Glycosyltransferase n=1 Tax=Flavobacterium gawalongense TaxID=2594432 RepID=A0A553BYU6_9FLAO|nr:glycosyltransferase [Flavobacterium gawalongense]TRX13395.1 glycosyltransferase [Flavobacterium gawalongense]TRX15675.1 glycosyltransferase [Flavobacterium gawalongense]TRX31513.1 glycosyltransferase [Flavobacterium gawalongense]
MKKKFSIIIPFYKGECFYPLLIESIKKAILVCQQDLISLEVITIIDSMESSFDTVNKLALDCFIGMENVNIVTLKNEKNIGVARTRNKAITISTGDYLHIIDQDDSVFEKFYLDLIPLLDYYNFVLSNGIVCYTNKKYNSHKLYYLTPRISVTGLLKRDFIHSPGQIVFLKKLLKNNLFPEPKDYKGADDRFFWLRLFMENMKSIKPVYIANPNFISNMHDNNYSNDQINLRKSSLEIWNFFKKEVDGFNYNKLIDNDIIRIKFMLKEQLSFYNYIKGGRLNLIYFLGLNKVLRYAKKRKIW